MTKVIAVINQKGGVGKTATACHLAYCFAKHKKRTLLLDIDPSANASSFFLGNVEPEKTTRDFLLNKEIDPACIRPAYQCDEKIPYLRLIPSHIGLAMAEIHLSSRPFREAMLAKKLREPAIREDFDCVIIDCPPTLSVLTINAMYAADFILIPVTYQRHALDGIADLFAVLSEIKEGQPYDYRILRNQHDKRKKHAIQYVDDALGKLRPITLNTIINQDEAVNRATLRGVTVFESCPHTSAAPDYHSLYTELEEILNV